MPQRKNTPAARAALARRRQRAAQNLKTSEANSTSENGDKSVSPWDEVTVAQSSAPEADKKYEKISNFGYVEKLSPQPAVPDRRDLLRYEAVRTAPQSPSISSKESTKGEQNAKQETSKIVGERIVRQQKLKEGTEQETNTKQQKSKESIVEETKNDFKHQKLKAGTVQETNAKQQKLKESTAQETNVKQQTSKSTIARTSKEVPKLVAKSTPKQNPTRTNELKRPGEELSGKALLASRIAASTSNISSKTTESINALPKRRTSPEKRVSPRRFRLPPKDPRAGKTNRSSRPSSLSLDNDSTFSLLPTPKSSGGATKETKPLTASIDDAVLPSATTITTLESKPPSLPDVVDLTDYLMDSCSIGESTIADIPAPLTEELPMQPQDNSDAIEFQDPVILSRYSMEDPSNRRVRTPNQSRYETNQTQEHPPQLTGYDKTPIKEMIDYQTKADTSNRTVRQPLSSMESKRVPNQSTSETQHANNPNRVLSIPETIDAACIHSGELVMLRSSSLSTTLQRNDQTQLISTTGPCLGKDDESFRIVRIGSGDGDSSVLRVGDIVVLLQTTLKGETTALGSRKRSNDAKYEIGFFGDGNELSDRWVVQSPKAGVEILVGRAALTRGLVDNGELIKYGNSVLLLNCSSGGILSIRDGKVILMTDSYDSSRTSLSAFDSSLMEKLERHDRIHPSMSNTFQFLKVSSPPCPSWAMLKGMGERLFLNGSYISQPMRNQKENIFVASNLPQSARENVLVDEIIGSFLGLEGLYIRLKGTTGSYGNHGSRVFGLFDGPNIVFDLSLRNLVEQILPLSTSYVCVRNFIGAHYPGYEYGRVMQAVCEGLDSFLQQFASFVAQLEEKIRNPREVTFTMKNIHFEITPLLHSMSVLEHTTKVICQKKGGALLNALRSLQNRVYMGDTVARDLLGTLIDRASVPYAEMLSIWLQSGRLCDPYEEFMIQKSSRDKQTTLDGDTWTTLFAIQEDNIIHDIVRTEKIRKKILVTGKYWNAVRSCVVDTMKSRKGTGSSQFVLRTLQFQSDLSEISNYIEAMYEDASNQLMNLLRDQFKLKESLQIMKRYFLLDQGDFLANFLETAGETLAKPMEEVSLGRIQHFLGISVHRTESQREEFRGHDFERNHNMRGLSPNMLRCRLSEQSLVSYLENMYGGINYLGPNTPSKQKYASPKQGTMGFDFFEIDFPTVPFPISLIISPTAMDNYKLIFRHLFFAKHVERRLVGVWSDHQILKKLDAVRGLMGPTFVLRQRMLHFVQNLVNYMTFEVVESNWVEMISLIEDSSNGREPAKTKTVDDLLNIHDGFLHKTIDACLLRNPVLIRSLLKLLNTCLLFTDQMKRFIDTTKIYDDSFTIADEKRDAVQRNLNERLSSHRTASRNTKKFQRFMMSVKEEREILVQRQTRRVGREICSDSYKRMISRFEEVFSADLASFMAQLNSHTYSGVVANLGIRLDWNGFVSKGTVHR